MPTINRKRRPLQKPIPSPATRVGHEYYNTSTWRRLRSAMFIAHPVCQMCEEKGIVTPTEEIHHITPISTGKTPLEMRYLAFDPNNLIALCSECHHRIHGKKINIYSHEPNSI